MNSLLSWFLLGIKTGIVAFGSGYVTIPFLYTNIVKSGLLSEKYFNLLLATSQMSPGPMSINFVSLIAFKLKGILASFLGVAGLLLFPFTGIVIYRILWKKVKPHHKESLSFYLLPLVSAFLLWAIFSLKFHLLLINHYFFYPIFIYLLFFTKLPLPYVMITAGLWELCQNYFL